MATVSTPDDEMGDEGYRSVSFGPSQDLSVPAGKSADFYVAVLVAEAIPDAEDAKPLYEESVVLVKATSQEQAERKAAGHGKQQEISYLDEHNRMLRWRLKHVLEVRPVEDATFDDGTELYSRFFRDYAGYRSFEPQLDGAEDL